MGALPDFAFRVNPGDLIPTALLALPQEEQIEKWGMFQGDIEDYFQNLAAFRGPYAITMLAGGAAVYANAPGGGAAEWAGSQRWRCFADLSNLTESRVSVSIDAPGAATASAAVQYSNDSGGSWQYLDGGSGPQADISSAGISVSEWAPMASGAQADVLLRFVHIAGDGAADPSVGLVVAQFR